MNVLLKASTIALLILGGTTVQTYAQRCNGDLVYFVRNQKGDLIDHKETLLLKYRRYDPTAEALVTKVGEEMFSPISLVRRSLDEKVITPGERAEWVKVLTIETDCGRRFAEVALEYENRKMVLRFLNMPPETNFLVDSLPFEEGTFEIDFKSDMYLKNQKLNREGLRHKDGSYYQRGAAQIGLLVAAENWTKTTAQQ